MTTECTSGFIMNNYNICFAFMGPCVFLFPVSFYYTVKCSLPKCYCYIGIECIITTGISTVYFSVR